VNWTISAVGFGLSFGSLIALQYTKILALIYLMVVSQGALGCGASAIWEPLSPNYLPVSTSKISFWDNHAGRHPGAASRDLGSPESA
jgi:hypothetical protein